MKAQLTFGIHLLLGLIAMSFANAQTAYFQAPEKGFTSWQPAHDWEDALLTGNGTMGAMVMGNPYEETIIINHAALYLPVDTPMVPINQASRLAEIRGLIQAGKYQEATKIPVELGKAEGYQGKHWTHPFIPAFDVDITLKPANISQYQRQVNYETGEAIVQWKDPAGTYQRKVFASRADSVVVISLTGTAKLTGQVGFDRRPVAWDQWEYINNHFKETNWYAGDDHLLYYQSEFKNKFENIIEGYEGVGKVIVKGGKKEVRGNQVYFENAQEVLLLVKVLPNENYDRSQVDQLKEQVNSLPADYATLLEAHQQVHGELFNQVTLDLGSDKETKLHSETMNLQARWGDVPTSIIEARFNAARYNIISATGYHPPNLQGIWGGAWTPPWSSGFTHDGNVEVAVSHLLQGNTPELMKAYFDYHEARLPHYRENAQKLYGCEGIHIPAHSTTHGWDNHFGETWCLTFWTGGAGWTAKFFYDYWLYTGDTSFLQNRAYPFMKEAARFYEDFLVEGESGQYRFNPSYSPENTPKNTSSQAAINATMDVMIAKELLRNSISAANTLGVDKKQAGQWRTMLDKMPDYQANEEGALREWLWEDLENNYDHRHISHLYALYDIMHPEFKRSPQLQGAARKVLEKHMARRRQESGGEMVFGLVQMAFVAANLESPELVSEMVDWMASYYWTDGMATQHNAGSLFNMDLSGGYPSVIMRSLVYSEPGIIKLLPAKPEDWGQGKMSGLLLRQQIQMNELAWEDNKVTIELLSKIDQKVRVQCPGAIQEINADKEGQITRLDGLNELFYLQLQAGEPVSITVILEKG